MATYLTRTPSSSGSNTTWTFSCWYKKASIGLDTVPFATGYTSPQIDEAMINIGADDQLRFNIAINDVTDVTVKSSRKLRDTSGFYHIVVACDTTQATASDRIKIYFNGELETNLSNTDYPTQNQSTFFGDTNKTQLIGVQPRSSNYLFGVMSHVHFTDGTAYDASAFGQYDANDVWTINTAPSVTYGTNGFFILKDGNSVTDQSGNSNNWTVAGGTLTNTEDSPSNVFATWNVLDNANASTMSNGNTKITTVTSNYSPNTSTLRTTLGKWYWEVKLAQHVTPGANEADMVGINNNSVQTATTNPSSIGINYRGNGRIWNYGGTSETPVGDYPTYSTGDIIMVAMDLSDSTTGKLYFGKNGTWGNSGNPVTGANSYDFTKGTEAWGAMVTTYSSGSSGIWEANFGNGYFGTTAVSSAGTNASGIGIFEYDVPTGYTALSTKGLNL